MKKIFIILNILIIVSHVSGQDRGTILQRSNDITLRQSVIDSIVNESFWAIKANYIRWYSTLYRKEDFSEFAKKTLLNYFSRELPDVEINNITNEVKKRLDKDIVKYKSEARRKSIEFDSYYNEIFNREIKKSIKIMSERARNQVSPLYARLLGWLNYKPSIPILESILQDSLINGYAKDNKGELMLNCKLALARMGNKKYENELLNFYQNINMDCNHEEYIVAITNLFYINTRTSINHVIKLSEKDTTFIQPYMYGLVTECSPKKINLLYIATVINNYPIKFEYEDSKDVNEMMILSPILYHSYPFFESQYKTLLQWLKANMETYGINTERFFQ
ncbi:MAG: hypothetical protein LBP63_06025 [Prevotellaceae bacterium]|jgi:hypothetical protein|nr:hypothetical protein [Prevotellaceae bacterium]